MSKRSKRPSYTSERGLRASTVQGELVASEQAPMVVVDFTVLETLGCLPRSDQPGAMRPVDPAKDMVVFMSHRWWSAAAPDDGNTKYGIVVRGLRALAKRQRLEPSDLSLWLDWGCIDQDNHTSQGQLGGQGFGYC